MTRDETNQYFLSKKGAWKDFPFDETTAVYKVGKKMFALMSMENRPTVTANLKCDPDLAADLRDSYEDIIPGYHMNKFD